MEGSGDWGGGGGGGVVHAGIHILAAELVIFLPLEMSAFHRLYRVRLRRLVHDPFRLGS